MVEYDSIEELNRKLREASASPFNDWASDIRDMHAKFGVREVIKKLSPEHLKMFIEFRLKFLEEELSEAKEAFAKLDKGTSKEDAISAADDIVDAMVDLCVVAIGTMDALSVNPYLAWQRVHGANMQKEPGVKPSRPNPLGLPDLIKPEGWTAPSHADNIGDLERLV